MSLGFSKFGWWVVPIWLAASDLLVTHVQAQGKPQHRRSIELSETNSAEILTNLTQLSTKKDGFKELNEQLRSAAGISSLNSMDGNFSVPYVSPHVPVVPRKALKELLDRQKNWTLNVEDLNTGTSDPSSDILSSYGEDKSSTKKSSLQQFYDGLNRRRPGTQNADESKNDHSVSKNELDSRNDPGSQDDSSLPPAIREKTRKLKESATAFKELVNEDAGRRSEERRVGKECRSRWSPYH